MPCTSRETASFEQKQLLLFLFQMWPAAQQTQLRFGLYIRKKMYSPSQCSTGTGEPERWWKFHLWGPLQQSVPGEAGLETSRGSLHPKILGFCKILDSKIIFFFLALALFWKNSTGGIVLLFWYVVVHASCFTMQWPCLGIHCVWSEMQGPDGT